MLAFQTRKVKFPGLNDSIFVAAIIYTSSLVLVILIANAFILSNYLNAFGAIFTVGIMILTTVFLALTFVPKVTHFCLYTFIITTINPLYYIITAQCMVLFAMEMHGHL